MHQIKTAIGFHMKQLDSKHAVYLSIALKLMKNTILNMFPDTEIVNTHNVKYLKYFEEKVNLSVGFENIK